MDDAALKDFIYGGVRELMKNRKYYYYSPIGQKYCHWTGDGSRALEQFMNLVGFQMIQNEEEDLIKRSKDMVLRGLKGENN